MWCFASNQIAHGLLCCCVQIHRMVIQGGEFRTEGSLKPKEVVSLLLDDAEVETRCEWRVGQSTLRRLCSLTSWAVCLVCCSAGSSGGAPTGGGDP